MAKKKRRYHLTKLEIGEFSCVDRAAQEGARMLIMKRDEPEMRHWGADTPWPDGTAFTDTTAGGLPAPVSKRLRLTSSDKGHSHLFDDNMEGGETSYTRSDGGEMSHDHPWVKNMDGSITIGDADGHSHSALLQKLEVSPEEEAKMFRKRTTKSERVGGRSVKFGSRDYAYVPDPEKSSTWKLRLTNTPGGSPDPRIVADAAAALGPGFRGNKVQIPSAARSAVIAKVRRAWLSANSDKTREDLPTVLKASLEDTDKNTNQEESEMTEEEITKLKDDLAKATAIGELSDAEKKFYKSLATAEQDAFLKATPEDRGTQIKKAQDDDEVLETEGGTVQKSVVGADVFAILKSQEARIDKSEKTAVAAAEREAKADLEKRVREDIPHLPGTPEVKMAILAQIDKIEDDDVRKAALAAQKAQNAEMAKAFEEHGTAEGTPDGTPQGNAKANLAVLVKKYQEEHDVTNAVAESEVLKTDEGAKLYEKMQPKPRQ